MKESLLNDLINEVALRCGDPRFEDFERDDHIRGLKRSNRKIAKKYSISTKVHQFLLRDYTGDLEADIILDEIEDMKAEFKVNVNGVDLLKKNDQLVPSRDLFCYYFEWRDEGWIFNYTLGGYVDTEINISGQDISEVMSSGITEKVGSGSKMGKSLEDEITILYTAVPQMDSKITDFLIPDDYQEEQIKLTLRYMAELGVVKFKEEKEKKYKKVLELNSNRSDYDLDSVQNSEWITIRPYIFP